VAAPEVPASLRSWTFAVGEIAHAVNAAEPLDAVLGLFYGPAICSDITEFRTWRTSTR
jgi:hypothetical protein